MSNPERIINVAANPIETAAAVFSSSALDALARRNRFIVALSGGSTPKKLFERLTAAPYREAINWRKVYFVWGDERCVPPNHPDSNFGMANRALLAPLNIPPANILRMEAEKPDLVASAKNYESQLRALLMEGNAGGRIDLVLLGMGADGHTASLFPGTTALDEKVKWVVANEVPQLKTWRMTLTFPVINASRKVLFLITGSDKATIVHEVLAGPMECNRLPSQAVRLQSGEVMWVLDAAAGEHLKH